jgi:hypothetical protein
MAAEQGDYADETLPFLRCGISQEEWKIRKVYRVFQLPEVQIQQANSRNITSKTTC